MITLSTEAGLVDVESWEAITSLPGFTTDVDPETTALGDIIGTYTLPDLVPCGLRCRQPHGHGYVVTLKDGRKTNLGKDCGRKHFKVEFEAKQKQYDRDLLRSQRQEIVRAAQHRCPAIIEELRAFRDDPRGADWVYRRSQKLLSGGSLPSYVATEIGRMVRAHDATIRVERRLTDEEAAQRQAMTDTRAERHKHADDDRKQRPQFTTDDVGTLDGLAALYEENNLRKLIVEDLEPQLEALRALGLEVRDLELGRWATWVSTIDEKLDRIKASIKLGQRLLTPRNINQLTKLARSGNDQRMITAFAKSLAEPSSNPTARPA